MLSETLRLLRDAELDALLRWCVDHRDAWASAKRPEIANVYNELVGCMHDERTRRQAEHEQVMQMMRHGDRTVPAAAAATWGTPPAESL